MAAIVVLLVLVGLVVLYKRSPLSDPAEVKRRYKNRSPEQKKVIRHFMVGGCLANTISDEEYEEHVKSFINQKNFKAEALDKIGLDEDELQEIEPVHFEGWVLEKEKIDYARRGKDGIWRSPAYQVSWLFFSESQVYLYRNTMYFDSDNKQVLTEEYFYKDITNFSTSSDTVETPYWDPKKKKYLLENVDSSRFALTVPGDKFLCSLEQSDYTDRAIRAMKAKLREKKSA